jgi:hypothetical protein
MQAGQVQAQGDSAAVRVEVKSAGADSYCFCSEAFTLDKARNTAITAQAATGISQMRSNTR